MAQVKTKDELIQELEPKARALAERIAGAVQELIECLAQQQAFIAEHKNKFPLYEMPGHWRIVEPLRVLAARPMDNESNALQRALIAYDKAWGGMATPQGAG